jgi:hypothetical protein
MTRHNSDQKKSDEHQRSSGAAGGGGAMSSHPPDLNRAQVTNAEKLEKDLKAGRDAPVEQHRSSRRPRQRREQNP